MLFIEFVFLFEFVFKVGEILFDFVDFVILVLFCVYGKCFFL